MKRVWSIVLAMVLVLTAMTAVFAEGETKYLQLQKTDTTGVMNYSMLKNLQGFLTAGYGSVTLRADMKIDKIEGADGMQLYRTGTWRDYGYLRQDGESGIKFVVKGQDATDASGASVPAETERKGLQLGKWYSYEFTFTMQEPYTMTLTVRQGDQTVVEPISWPDIAERGSFAWQLRTNTQVKMDVKNLKVIGKNAGTETVLEDRTYQETAEGNYYGGTTDGVGGVDNKTRTSKLIVRKVPEVKEISLGTDGNIISGTAYTAQAVTVDPNGYDQEAQVALTWQTSADGTSWTDAGSGAAYTPATPGSFVRVKAVATGTIDGKVSADTFSAVKQVGVANPKLTFAINGNGSVKYQDTSYQNGDSLTANNGDNVTLTVESAYGYKIGSVTAGGQELTASQEGTVTLENLNVDTDVVVTFAEREKEKPSAVANSKVQSQNDYKVSADQDPVFAAVLYSRVNEGYGYTISETGIKLENDQGRFLMLPCVGSWAETKAYGIRVFGAGLVEGTRYTMTPYVKVVDPATGDAEYLYGEPESFTK